MQEIWNNGFRLPVILSIEHLHAHKNIFQLTATGGCCVKCFLENSIENSKSCENF